MMMMMNHMRAKHVLTFPGYILMSLAVISFLFIAGIYFFDDEKEVVDVEEEVYTLDVITGTIDWAEVRDSFPTLEIIMSEAEFDSLLRDYDNNLLSEDEFKSKIDEAIEEGMKKIADHVITIPDFDVDTTTGHGVDTNYGADIGDVLCLDWQTGDLWWVPPCSCVTPNLYPYILGSRDVDKLIERYERMLIKAGIKIRDTLIIFYAEAGVQKADTSVMTKWRGQPDND